jgi:hypothetical protein
MPGSPSRNCDHESDSNDDRDYYGHYEAAHDASPQKQAPGRDRIIGRIGDKLVIGPQYRSLSDGAFRYAKRRRYFVIEQSRIARLTVDCKREPMTSSIRLAGEPERPLGCPGAPEAHTSSLLERRSAHWRPSDWCQYLSR